MANGMKGGGINLDAMLELKPCVFFDRDGVVNEAPGDGYVLKKEDFRLNQGIVESLRIVKDRGYLAVIVTSQKCVGKNLISQEDLNHIHHSLQIELRQESVNFDAIYAYTGAPGCEHLPKPDPAMIYAAAKDFPIDLSRSWIIGDADRDIEMGRNASLRGTIRIRGDKPIQIEADHTLNSTWELPKLLRKVL
jgi:D-glycero-D-manno-heptose 1,7-bisphosphate phosphatase